MTHLKKSKNRTPLKRKRTKKTDYTGRVLASVLSSVVLIFMAILITGLIYRNSINNRIANINYTSNPAGTDLEGSQQNKSHEESKSGNGLTYNGINYNGLNYNEIPHNIETLESTNNTLNKDTYKKDIQPTKTGNLKSDNKSMDSKINPKIRSHEKTIVQTSRKTKSNINNPTLVSHAVINSTKIKKMEKEHTRVSMLIIVIDDVGYKHDTYDAFLSLDIPLTYAVIPETPYADYYYQRIKKTGNDVILHIPMEPLKGRKFVESNALISDMTDIEIKDKINRFLSLYPDVIGANNHMGSKLINDTRIMSIILETISSKGIFWLDSYTTGTSLPLNISNMLGLKYYRRDEFLDNIKTTDAIKSSMERLIKKARINGYAVGIGHIQTKQLPGVLKSYADRQNQLSIKFVTLDKIK